MEADGSGVVHHLTWLTHKGGTEIQENIWKGTVKLKIKETDGKPEQRKQDFTRVIAGAVNI